MAIRERVLGRPGKDNALFVEVDSGQELTRLLFDCGEGCLGAVPVRDIQAIDHLFFSHFHMDHVSGFDSFFRHNYDRPDGPVEVWGPRGTARIIQHRMLGFQWNLHEGRPGTWRVHEIGPGEVRRTRYRLDEAFAVVHDDGAAPRRLDTPAYSVEPIELEHRGPCLGYVVREKPRQNIDPEKLAAVGGQPGPWLKDLKEGGAGEVELCGKIFTLDELRAELVVETRGGSLAYLTDFVLDDDCEARLVTALRGVDTMVCEAQYAAADTELARTNHHLTVRQTATLAARAQVGRLVLFHLSPRYTEEEWHAMLADAQAIFPNAGFSSDWFPATAPDAR